jgi:peptidyl-prolyl cis-trans isomerase C
MGAQELSWGKWAMQARSRFSRWRGHRLWLATALGLAMGTGVAVMAVAQAPGDRAVVRVSDTVITAAQIQQQLTRVPVFQLRMLGETDGEIRSAFANQLIDVELYVQGALEDKLDQRSDVRDRIRDVLRGAVIADITKEAMEAAAVSDEAIKAYYDEHRERYEPQKRIKLWHIVVKERAEAEHILKLIDSDPEYQKDPTAGWEKLARERSLDKSTSMRNGELGFVKADGKTAHKDVTVSPALFKAALAVKNGEVVPRPLKDGDFWVVLQRRGSHVTPERTLASETSTIRAKLAKKQVRVRAEELLNRLRGEYVSELMEKRIDEIVVNVQGDVEPRRRPGTLRRRSHPAAKPPSPSGPPGRLR